jgi:hypothetical protein
MQRILDKHPQWTPVRSFVPLPWPFKRVEETLDRPLTPVLVFSRQYTWRKCNNAAHHYSNP